MGAAREYAVKCQYTGFLVFAFDRSRPRGGIADLIGIRSTRKAAYDLAKSSGKTDWQIVKNKWHEYTLDTEGFTLNGREVMRGLGQRLGEDSYEPNER